MTARILAIVPYFIPRIGGGETHLYQIAELLSKKGHSITILTQRLPGTPRYEENENIKIIRFGKAITQNGRYRAYNNIMKFVKNNEFENTVLYLYLSVGNEFRTKTMCCILSVAREKGIPRVARIPSSNRVTELSELYPEGIEELKKVDHVISLNPGIREELISFGVHPNRIKAIPNGVNIDLFQPSPIIYREMRKNIGCALDSIVFLCPSRLAPKKKIPDLIQLWKRIGDIDLSSELWIVGNDQLEAKRGNISRRIKKLIKKLEVINLRWFAGGPHPIMPKYFQASDIYISLSQKEGMSNAMLEAMATCLPIIAPSTKAVCPLIQDGINGFLFTPGDIASAENAILRFLHTSEEVRKEMGKRNRDLILRNHKIEDIGQIFSKLFNQMLSKH